MPKGCLATRLAQKIAKYLSSMGSFPIVGAKSAPTRPNLVKSGQCRRTFWPSEANIGPTSANVGHTSPALGQLWPTSEQVRPTGPPKFEQVRSEFAEVGLVGAGFAPKMGTEAGVGQRSPCCCASLAPGRASFWHVPCPSVWEGVLSATLPTTQILTSSLASSPLGRPCRRAAGLAGLLGMSVSAHRSMDQKRVHTAK